MYAPCVLVSCSPSPHWDNGAAVFPILGSTYSVHARAVPTAVLLLSMSLVTFTILVNDLPPVYVPRYRYRNHNGAASFLHTIHSYEQARQKG